MTKVKTKVSDLMLKHGVDFETARQILSEMGLEAKNKTKGVDEHLIPEFEKKLAEQKKVGQVTEKEGVTEKVVKKGIKRRITAEVHEKPEVPEAAPAEPVVPEKPVEEKKEVRVPEKPVSAEKVPETGKQREKEHTKHYRGERPHDRRHRETPATAKPETPVREKEDSISQEQKEKIQRELEQSLSTSAKEVKTPVSVEFQKKDRHVQEKKPYQRPPYKREKFEKQIQEQERALPGGKREIIMSPTPGEVPVDQKGHGRKGFEKKKEVLRKDQLLELKEREEKLQLQKKRRDDEGLEKPVQKKPLKIAEAITVADLAKKMGVKVGLVLKTLLDLGTMATINHVLDADTAAIVASEYGYEVEKLSIDVEDMIAEEHATASEEKRVHRSPVVTIMGHVDHGKTSLLDAIRKTNVVAREAGGITQHIGAYQVEIGRGTITFLDTPGHEAFTAMRARGAKVTDIVVLVVAADEGIMPQTIEALNHAKAAEVPIIVAVNKIDKPGANPDKIKNQLSERGLIPEEWGGHTVFAEVSAKKLIGIQELLDLILIQAEVLELKANPEKLARGIVVESKLDKGRGPVATVLVQEGTLKVGDPFITGIFYGRVRSLINDKGKKIDTAGPATPVEVLGLPGVPEAGEGFIIVSDERKARQIAGLRENKLKEKEMAKKAKLSLEDVYERIQLGEIQALNIVLKGDVQGSVEAISESLTKISTTNLKVEIIHSGVGTINESDVMLAEASKAVIIGFNVKPDQKAQALAEKHEVDIKLYSIIYELIDNVKLALEGLLKPIEKEVLVGKAEVRQIFSIPKIGLIAGSYVNEGKIARNNRVKVVRDKAVIFEGKVGSLKRMKDDVREVQQGYECGIGVEGFGDVKVGDVIEFYEIHQIAVKFEDVQGK